jgi:hypothetical protein
VIEDDIADLAMPILDHRIVYKNKESKANALTQIVQREIERLAKRKIHS